MAFIAHYLYRKPRCCAILLLLLLVLLPYCAFSQSRSKGKANGPRALALVELPAEPKARPRLIPITVLYDGKYFDATLFWAIPRPLALDSGTVYEAERNGEPAGFFTTENAKRVHGEWVAEGQWQPITPALSQPARVSRRAAVDSDEPPVLKRGSGAPPQAAGEVQRPAETATSAAEVPSSEDLDPNRPILRRSKPKPKPEPEPEPAPPAQAAAAPGHAAPRPVKPSEILVAVSDAAGPEPRPYLFHWNPDEQQRLSKAIMALASAEVVRFARANPALKIIPASTFDDVRLRAFDLDYDNNPELVFSARVAPAAPPATAPRSRSAKAAEPAVPKDFYFYVTVVAREDPDGELHKLFASVTDTTHLDVFPRHELVDAVDAEGDGRGDLLFRAIRDTGKTYQLYRVGRDSLWKLFEGGSAAE